MTGSGPLLGEDRPHPACDECGRPLDPDVAHIDHGDPWEWAAGYSHDRDGCDCPEVCASCCVDPDCRHPEQGQPLGVYGTGGGGQMTRGRKATRTEAPAAMGIDWMNRHELSQAIPPAYCEFIGRELMRVVRPGAEHKPVDSSPARTLGTSASLGHRTGCHPNTGDPAGNASSEYWPRSRSVASAAYSPESSRGQDALG